MVWCDALQENYEFVKLSITRIENEDEAFGYIHTSRSMKMLTMQDGKLAWEKLTQNSSLESIELKIKKIKW